MIAVAANAVTQLAAQYEVQPGRSAMWSRPETGLISAKMCAMRPAGIGGRWAALAGGERGATDMQSVAFVAVIKAAVGESARPTALNTCVSGDRHSKQGGEGVRRSRAVATSTIQRPSQNI